MSMQGSELNDPPDDPSGACQLFDADEDDRHHLALQGFGSLAEGVIGRHSEERINLSSSFLIGTQPRRSEGERSRLAKDALGHLEPSGDPVFSDPVSTSQFEMIDRLLDGEGDPI